MIEFEKAIRKALRKAKPIGDTRHSVSVSDGRVWYFADKMPVGFHDEGDRDSLLDRIIMLAEFGVEAEDLAKAFGSKAVQEAMNKCLHDDRSAQ